MRTVDFKYFIVGKDDVQPLCSEELFAQFLAFVYKSHEYVTLPWGEHAVDLSGWVVDEEDYRLQEQVFTAMSLDLQNLVYRLDLLQLNENPQRSAQLVYSVKGG